MPVVGIPVNMLLERLGTRLDRDDLVEHLQHLGCDVEGYATVRRFRCNRCDNVAEITSTENPPVLCDRCGADFKEHTEQQIELSSSDVIRMELLAVRPDMFEPGGLARVLRNYLGERSAPARYELAAPRCSVTVDPSLQADSSFRPSIACAIVRNFTLTDELIKVIMKLQENLHWAMGRDRKHASIGVYDLDTVTGPDFHYRTVGSAELRFTPLGYDPAREDQRLTPAQILTQHPKGQAYARLLSTFTRYPLLSDSQGQVLSLPPIINSESTRVRRTTTHFFIDVTGTGDRIVNKCLNIIVTALAELDPLARLEQVLIKYPDREVRTPDLTAQIVELNPTTVARTIGVDLTFEDVERHLRQMGHGLGTSAPAGRLLVQVPAYRNDIMHPIDLAEDVAIAYGYHNIVPRLVPTMTVGGERPIEVQSNVARQVMTGLGFYEIMTLLLSSPEANYDALLLPREEDCVLIDNPISHEQTLVRTSLIPGMLDTFSVNTNHELPQRLFEVGNITLLDQATETGAREHRYLAAGAIGPKVDYAEIRSVGESLLREFGCQLEVQPADRPCFIPGRGARLIVCRGAEKVPCGWMGELQPQILERYKLIHPVAVLELELALLIET
jgi:phenylalanyl-tRNA synthetase beta chain